MFGASVTVAAVTLLALAVGAGGKSSAPVVPSHAQAIATLPSTVTGVADAKARSDEPVPWCATTTGSQWYTLKAPHRGAMLARLVAHENLDAALVVYRIVRSQRLPVLCNPTNRHGRARIAWYAHAEGSYLLGVARRSGSAKAPYSLTVLAADRPPRPPGTSLPATGVHDTLNAVLDSSDAWAVQLDRGVTYRLDVTTPSRTTCVEYALYRPGTASFARGHAVLHANCGGYETFTPGGDGGGLYTVLVQLAGSDPVDHAYRLEVVAAGTDDTAPGVKLENGQLVTGTLTGRGIDEVDLYRFDVPRENELTMLELQQKATVAFGLSVLSEMGSRVGYTHNASGRQVLRLHLPPGHYYAALTARSRDTGRYSLRLFVRDVTTTSVDANGGRAADALPGQLVPLTVHVTSASHGGRVVVQVDHFDPLFHWHFAAVVAGSVDASGVFTTSWLPPSVGEWRVRARFLPNPYSSFSESGYVHVHVADALQ